jgi:hypothetical protein
MNDKVLTDRFDVHQLFESIWHWQKAVGGDVDAVAYSMADAIIEAYRKQRNRFGRKGLTPALRNLMYMRDALEQVVSDPRSNRMQRIRMIVNAELSSSGLDRDKIGYRGYFRLNLARGNEDDQDSKVSVD